MWSAEEDPTVASVEELVVVPPTEAVVNALPEEVDAEEEAVALPEVDAEEEAILVAEVDDEEQKPVTW